MSGISQSISQTAQDRSDSDLMEAAVEEFFDFWPFEGDRLELSFVVVVEERQSLSSVCRKTHKLHVNCSFMTTLSTPAILYIRLMIVTSS